MSRRRNDGEGSLELLLDTICNMFGGIVLIAILLAVLSRETGRAKAEDVVTHDVAQKQEGYLKVLSNKLERVKGELSDLLDVENVPVEKVDEDQIDKLKNLIAAKKNEKQLEEKEKDEFEYKIEEIKEKIRLLAEKAEVQEIDQTEVRVPVAHKVDKTPVLIFIKNKRYFPVTQMEKDGTPGERGLDESICTVGLLLGGFGYISLNEGVSGQLIRGRAPVDGYFKTMMSVLNKNKEMLKFFVYEDSFEEFNLLKRHIVSEGINYMWIPMENSEERLFFSTQGGGGGTGGVQVF